jgi:hypothetical protein
MSSAALRPEQVDAAFLALRYTRALDALGPRITDADYWRELNPTLTVSDEPPAARAAVYPRGWASDARVQARLCDDGYCVTPPIVPPDEVARLRVAVERIVARGLPPGCALMYDEFYRMYAGVLAASEPIMGPDPVLLPEDFWAFFVPPGDGAGSYWTAFPPHRDWVNADPSVMAGDLPSVLVGWIALSDVSTDDSCLYAVPGSCDAGFRSGNRAVDPTQFRLEDIRALPVSAGQVVMFSTHIAHWGSRSSRWATHPRISVSVLFQRRDAPARLADVVDLRQPVAVEQRARWVLRTLRMMLGKDESAAIAARAGLTPDPHR